MLQHRQRGKFQGSEHSILSNLSLIRRKINLIGLIDLQVAFLLCVYINVTVSTNQL